MSQGLTYGIGLAVWAVTLAHANRTQTEALSDKSQRAWMLGLIFLPALFIPFYWLTEAGRRRRRRPPATGAAA